MKQPPKFPLDKGIGVGYSGNMKTLTIAQYYHWQQTGQLPELTPKPKRVKRVKPGRFAGCGEPPPMNYPEHLDPAWRVKLVELAEGIKASARAEKR